MHDTVKRFHVGSVFLVGFDAGNDAFPSSRIRPFADCLGDKLKNRAGRATERKKHEKAVELHGLVLFVPEK